MTACSANSLGGEKVSWSSSSSSWASSVVSAMRFLLSQQHHGGGTLPRPPPCCTPLRDERLLRPEPGLRPHVQLVVGALGTALGAEDRAQPAAEEAERDRDDARVGEL